MEPSLSTGPMQRFNLVFPASLEAAVSTCLQDVAPPLPDYTLIAGEGHGAVFEGASLGEQVRGHVKRQLLVMVLPESRVPALVEALGARIKDARVRWWTEAILANGALG